MNFIFTIIKNIFAIIGAVTTVIGCYELWIKFEKWQKEKREREFKINLLDSLDKFLAHIIHLGGEFSMNYTMQVRADHVDGGIYLNPPGDFVWVGWNRCGDSMVITASEIVGQAGFILDYYEDKNLNKFSCTGPDICHLPILEDKNEYTVFFKKKPIKSRT